MTVRDNLPTYPPEPAAAALSAQRGTEWNIHTVSGASDASIELQKAPKDSDSRILVTKVSGYNATSDLMELRVKFSSVEYKTRVNGSDEFDLDFWPVPLFSSDKNKTATAKLIAIGSGTPVLSGSFVNMSGFEEKDTS